MIFWPIVGAGTQLKKQVYAGKDSGESGEVSPLTHQGQ